MNYLIKNPCLYVKKYVIIETKIKVFSETEIELLLNNITNPTLLNIVKFAFLSGLRLNEILNLQVSNINFENEIISIENKANFTLKSKRNKTIILNVKLKTLLNEMLFSNSKNEASNILNIAGSRSPEKYIFTVMNRINAIDKSYISKLFKRECRKLNLNESLHFHSIRHTYISRLINKGISINIVKELVQHSSINTTMKYVSIDKNILSKYANM